MLSYECCAAGYEVLQARRSSWPSTPSLSLAGQARNSRVRFGAVEFVFYLHGQPHALNARC